MVPQKHKHLSYNHLGDTKTSTCLQQNIKKCLLCLYEKLAIITYPSQNTLQNKKCEILSNVGTRTNTFSHTSIHTHNPSNTSNIYTPQTSLKHRKYHFPPPTITPATQYKYHLSQLTPILFSTRLHYLLILMRIKNRPEHSTFILSTTYTRPFSTIAYISLNINIKHIDIKNNHPNRPTITHTPQTCHLFPEINFLKFIMTILCFSVMIIIVHKHTNYYCSPFIIFMTHILPKRTIVYIIFTQLFINLLLYPCPILFAKYYTNIVQHYIAIQYTLTYTRCDSGQP